MPSLLDSAKKIILYQKLRRDITHEDIELALAWLQGEARYTQIKQAKGLSEGSNVYNYLCIALRRAFENGKLNIKKKSIKGRLTIKN